MTEPSRSRKRFAEGTTVSIEASRAELRRILQRYGADQFSEHEIPNDLSFAIDFRFRARWYRFTVTAPAVESMARDSDRVDLAMLQRWPDSYTREWATLEKRRLDEYRRRWRVLCRTVQMKMEAIEDGDINPTSELLGYLLLPNNRTFSEASEGEITAMYETGKAPDPNQFLLPG